MGPGALVDVCGCPPGVKTKVTIQPAIRNTGFAVAVRLTICDCDRHKCVVGDCYELVDPGTARRCANGHKN